MLVRLLIVGSWEMGRGCATIAPGGEAMGGKVKGVVGETGDRE